MQLGTGAQLGPYVVLGHLGTGGMGEVYRARDTRLDRTVAVKVLSRTHVFDFEGRRRFFQEAKAASALNHPNIVTVHDIGAADVGAATLDYIVMEYLDGTTLEQRIHARTVAVADALKYGVQIADAVATAHRAGIIHRDLKPSNVMVTERGLVKVLDFGVAKLGEASLPGDLQDGVNTIDAPASTMEGVIVGTVAYMSPEQAEGRKVDGRSDIFSFGVLLYELLTGRRPFTGTSRLSTLAAILERDYPPLVDTVTGIPPELDRVVGRCLRKDPERRFQHMDDVRVALEELRDESISGRFALGSARTAGVPLSSGTLPAAPRASRRGRRGVLIAGGVAIALLAAAATSLWRSSAPRPPFNPVLHRLTSDSGLTAFPALSPDGKLLAYASDRIEDGGLDIWVEQMGSSQPLRLTDDPADDSEPVFSPDGTRIAFRSERSPAGIYVSAALGGELRLVAQNGRRPRFSPDGASIAYWVGAVGWLPGSSSLYVVPVGGGQAKRIAPRFAAARHPIWTPDGKLLFVGHPGSALSEPELADWWLAPVDRGAPVKTGALDAFRAQDLSVPLLEPVIVPDGWLDGRVVFSASTGDTTNVWAVPVAPSTGRVTGAAERLTQGTGEMYASVALGTSGIKLAFAGLSSNVDVWSVPMNHVLAQTAGRPERLTDSTGFDGYPSASGDSTTLVYVSQRAGAWDIVLRDLTTARDRVLATSSSATMVPQISGDGSTVAYWDKGKLEAFVMPAGGGPAEKICTECGPPTQLSGDGRRIVTEGALLVDREHHRQVQLAVSPAHPDYVLFGGRFSPDGRWVSFHARTGSSEQRQIFVAPVHDGRSADEREWIPITDGSVADRESSWSPDGRTLYFLSDRDGFRCIWAQRLHGASRHPAGAPFPVLHAHHARRTLTRVSGGPAAIGLSVTRDRLLFSQSELTGNVWVSSWADGDR
jgi:eukaryotic-like serine/threonine-protein kinase